MTGDTPKTARSELNRDSAGILVAVVSFLLGGWFRIFPAFLAGFPVNDGGMFYTMINDLQANRYQLPFHTSYNHLNIPFAYPPLAFYVGAGISDVFNIPSIEIVRWLPGIVNIFCLLAFYFLAKEIAGDTLTSAASTFIYAMIPHMSEWPSMGGGLTRSFGMLFMTLTVLYAHRLFTADRRRDLWNAIFFGCLTVLSHPESIVYSLGICAYLWLAKSRTLKSLFNGALAALGVLSLTAPWYGLILYRHGVETLIAAIQTGRHSLWASFILLNMDGVTAEPYLDLLGVLCVLGIAVLIVRKQYFIPGMLLVIYLIGPRSAHTVGNIALALGGGFFVTEIILPVIFDWKSTPGNTLDLKRGIAILLAVAAPYLLLNSAYQGYSISRNHVEEPDRAAMRWVMDNTPADSTFLVLTGDTDAMCDAVSEWFPSLAGRASLTTVQGREWLLGGEFDEFINHRADIQRCVNGDLTCVERQAAYFAKYADYIYVSTKPATHRCVPGDAASQGTPNIVDALRSSPDYTVAYNDGGVFIIRRND